MKYYKVDFRIEPMSEDASDVLAALLADTGFETFEPTSDGLTAYVQQSQWNEELVNQCIQFFPIQVSIHYNIEEAPDEDWNTVWEEEGFEPMVLGDLICVHDTKHANVPPCKYDIVINPKMAFGTGTHPTTQMILQKLTEMDLKGKNIVDAGCGTGVLGILAMKLGAQEVFAYDIDEWSVENAKENFPLNGINNATVELGDSAVLKGKTDVDLLIANINRNILLGDICHFAEVLKEGGKLLLSGFYTQDVPFLAEEAGKYGLKIEEKRESKDWSLLVLG